MPPAGLHGNAQACYPCFNVPKDARGGGGGGGGGHFSRMGSAGKASELLNSI